MSMPFYVSPEQIIKDKADYARKGIARGRSVVVLQYAGGLLFVAENRSRALHKITEIYDRIAFAAVGKYNEFENLRVAGVRLADLRGYSYDRRDVIGPEPRERLRPDARHDLHRDAEAVRGGDRRRRGRRRRRTTTSSTASRSTARSATSTASSAMGGSAEQIIDRAQGALGRGHGARRRAAARRRGTGRGARGRQRRASRGCSRRPSSRSRCSTAPGRGASSAGSRATGSPSCSASRTTPTTSRATSPDDEPDAQPGAAARLGLSRLAPDPRAALRPPSSLPRVRTWTGGSSGSRRSTASPAPSGGSGGSRRTRSPATCSAGSCPGAGPATSSCATAPASTSTSAATRSTRRRSATTSSELVAHDKAGERILEGLLVDAEKRLDEEGIAGDVYLFKNNTDSAGQLLRLPRELPRRAPRRVLPPRRRAHPVPRLPADRRAARARCCRRRAARSTA